MSNVSALAQPPKSIGISNTWDFSPIIASGDATKYIMNSHPFKMFTLIEVDELFRLRNLSAWAQLLGWTGIANIQDFSLIIASEHATGRPAERYCSKKLSFRYKSMRSIVWAMIQLWHNMLDELALQILDISHIFLFLNMLMSEQWRDTQQKVINAIRFVEVYRLSNMSTLAQVLWWAQWTSTESCLLKAFFSQGCLVEIRYFIIVCYV